MSQMKKNFYLQISLTLFVFLSLSSCKKEIVTYQTPEFPKHTQLEVTELNNDYLFRYAYRSLAYDSLLIIATLDEAHHICVFNRHTGELIIDFGAKGNGPNELITPTEYSIDYSKGILYVNDYGKQAVLCYNLDSLKKTEVPSPQKIKFAHSFRMKTKILFVKDSLFYSPDYEHHFLTAYPSKIEEEIYSPVVDKEKFPSDKEWNEFMAEYAIHAINPDGTKCAIGSSLGGILEIFDMSNNSTARSAIKLFYEPIFKRNGHVYRETDETIGGFCHLAATNNFLYAIAHGKKAPQSMPTQIFKFDWSGNPIECLHCPDYPIDCFTVIEEENLIYAIATNQEGEQCIVQMRINDNTLSE